MKILTHAQVRRMLEQIAPYVEGADEYARRVGCSRTAAVNRAARGNVTAVKVANRYLIVREDVSPQAAA